MHFSKFSRLSGIVCLTLLSTFANAGVGSSGGGAAAVCRNWQTGMVASSQMLDLYEGSVLYGYQYPAEENDADTELKITLARFDYSPFIKALVTESINRVQEAFVFLPEGVGIHTPADLGNDTAVVVPEGCRIEAAGYYQKDGRLFVSRAVYRMLSPRNRAAFILHEGIYRIARERSGHKSATATRRLVAALFATQTNIAEIEILRRAVFYAPWTAQELEKTGIILSAGSPEHLTMELHAPKQAYGINDFRWLIGQLEMKEGFASTDGTRFKGPVTGTDTHLFENTKPYTVKLILGNQFDALDPKEWTVRFIHNGSVVGERQLEFKLPDSYTGVCYKFHFARPAALLPIPLL